MTSHFDPAVILADRRAQARDEALRHDDNATEGIMEHTYRVRLSDGTMRLQRATHGEAARAAVDSELLARGRRVRTVVAECDTGFD